MIKKNLGDGVVILFFFSHFIYASPIQLNTLEEYLNKHDYIPTEQGNYFPWYRLTRIGNQNSFYVSASTTLNSVTVNYYSDSACFINSSSKVLNGPAVLHEGTYITTDQSNYALCSAYAGGCNALFSAAGSMITSIQFTYTFSNGVSTVSPCMYNIAQGYEVLADYSTPSTPVACSNGSSCGYSQAYASVELGIPYVSTNDFFSCALSDANSSNLVCWGTGSSGQIGNGADNNVNVPTSVVMPSGVNNFSLILTNGNFSCAIAGSGSNTGKMYCWGNGTNGRLGNGTNSNANVPTSVVMPSNVGGFGIVSTNNGFGCAIANSGSNAGVVYCWGVGVNGRIGNGANSNVNVPTSVIMPSNVGSFNDISTNNNFSCAIAGSGNNAGKIYCWGLAVGGQIGNGANSSVNVPTSVIMPSGVDNFNIVSTNTNFSCAIAGSGSNTGKIYCWGVGDSGQIGNGVNSNVNVPTSVTMPSGVDSFNAVSTNANFSCAVAGSGSNTGKIYCWGVGTDGRIGNGANSNVNVPTPVTMPSGVDSFSSVSTNANFSCAVAGSGSNTGKIYCWGIGTNGQIGNGANNNVNVPTSVIMPYGVDSFGLVSTNSNFSCAIAGSGSNTGKIYCWGIGTNGQIGNGANSNVNVPTLTL